MQLTPSIDSYACADIIPPLPIISRFRNDFWEHSTGNYRYLNYLIQSCKSYAKMDYGFSEAACCSLLTSRPSWCPCPSSIHHLWGMRLSCPTCPSPGCTESVFALFQSRLNTNHDIGWQANFSLTVLMVRGCSSCTVSLGFNSKSLTAELI